jgi:hypothetical protein
VSIGDFALDLTLLVLDDDLLVEEDLVGVWQLSDSDDSTWVPILFSSSGFVLLVQLQL